MDSAQPVPPVAPAEVPALGGPGRSRHQREGARRVVSGAGEDFLDHLECACTDESVGRINGS